jgi:antitoxin (DNA-binding transcriptional repressor) of toxin-antitoxin stability system
MKQVGIAELTARFSEHLRAVRRGESIAVLDGGTLVAHIVPVRERSKLQVRTPAPGTPPLGRVRLPKSARLDLDVVRLLLDERQEHR